MKFDTALMNMGSTTGRPAQEPDLRALGPSPLKELARKLYSRTFCNHNYEWQKMPKEETHDKDND